MTSDQEILVRLDRIEQVLSKLANISLPPADNQNDRLLRLARIDPEASKEALREISRQFTINQRKSRNAERSAQK